MAQTVKYLPAMQETRVQYLGQEDPLEKGMADSLPLSHQGSPGILLYDTLMMSMYTYQNYILYVEHKE